MTIEIDPPAEPRILELVNKTNQFNLNGRRHTPADWNGKLGRTGAFLAAISYQDRFGPLGKIAVIQGFRDGGTMHIDTWVMSCRAFSRRIEHQCLQTLLNHYDAQQISFDFQATAKNGPVQDFFERITGERPSAPFDLTRKQLERNVPSLYHQVDKIPNPNPCPTTPVITALTTPRCA